MSLLNSFVKFRSGHLAGAALALALLGGCTKNPDGPTVVVTSPAPEATNSEARAYADYSDLKWSDEFDAPAIDQTKWGFELGGGGWGNRELEFYTSSTDNAFINNGNLVIQAKQQSMGGMSYTSARMLTKGKQSFQFGRIDVRAKMPKGQGLWPAIWMMGSDIDTNNWPKCGEIDMMELRGQQPNKFLTTMHFAKPDGSRELKGGPDQTLANGNFSDDFHVFSSVRSKNQIRFYLDGNLYYTFTNGDVGGNSYPFNNPFFMLLNVAVGGDFLGNPDATTVFPQQMQVDYVRYYQYK